MTSLSFYLKQSVILNSQLYFRYILFFYLTKLLKYFKYDMKHENHPLALRRAVSVANRGVRSSS